MSLFEYISAVYKRIRVRMNAMYLVQGEHLPSAIFPQLFAAPPAPAGAWCQPRLVGPYVLVAPPARVDHRSPLLPTFGNHVQASSASFLMDELDKMSLNELHIHVQDMEIELGIPRVERFEPFNLSTEYLHKYIKTVLIPKKKVQLRGPMEALASSLGDWTSLVQELNVKEYTLHDKFDFDRFGPKFFTLIHKTQTLVESMKEKNTFGRSYFYAGDLGNLLDEVKRTLTLAGNLQNPIFQPRYVIPASDRHWTQYRDAIMSIRKSMNKLQHRQIEIIQELDVAASS